MNLQKNHPLIFTFFPNLLAGSSRGSSEEYEGKGWSADNLSE
jgi:hypothetical protein